MNVGIAQKMSRLEAVPNGSHALPCREPTSSGALFATACRGRAVVIPADGMFPERSKWLSKATSFRSRDCDTAILSHLKMKERILHGNGSIHP